MNYLVHNGYKESFELFRGLRSNGPGLKTICNFRDSVNKGVVLREESVIETPMARYRSNSLIRKDSEGMRSRRASLMRDESQTINDNKDVLDLLSHRSGWFNRT